MKINNDILNNANYYKSSNAEAQRASKEFESMFMQMMLKEMHPKIDSEGILGPSKSEDMFYQIMDEQIARDMVDSGQSQLGLKEALAREYFQAP